MGYLECRRGRPLPQLVTMRDSRQLEREGLQGRSNILGPSGLTLQAILSHALPWERVRERERRRDGKCQVGCGNGTSSLLIARRALLHVAYLDELAVGAAGAVHAGVAAGVDAGEVGLAGQGPLAVVKARQRRRAWAHK